MDTVRLGLRIALMLAALLATARLAPAAPLDIDEGLRRKALALNDVTGDDPILGKVKELAADPQGTKNLLAAAVSMAKDKTQPFNYNAAYILARSAQEVKDLEGGRIFYRVCADQALKLKSGQKLAQAFGGLIDLLYEHKKYDESEKVCKEFLEVDDEDPRVKGLKSAVLRRMIQAIAKQGKGDQALKLTDNYIKARGDNWLAYELKAWVLREVGQVEDSAKAYEEVLDRIQKDKALENAEKEEYAKSARYILSGVYVDLNKIDKAAEHLKTLLDKEPDDPTYNNDLGYIWADHDMNLDEAEKMVRKALEKDKEQRLKADPDQEAKPNAAYLDSLGWVLFKKKKYKEAKEPLLKAVEDKEGQHVEIFDHLGDVHWALGEKEEAFAAWKKGIEGAGTTKREQEKKAKVEEKVKKYQSEK